MTVNALRERTPRLIQAEALAGFTLRGLDGEIGKAKQFYFDDQTWAIRRLVIDTQNWWPGRKVLVAPQWIERVLWRESKAVVALSREQIRRSPEYTEWSVLTREFEIGLHQHYNRSGYWPDDTSSPVAILTGREPAE